MIGRSPSGTAVIDAGWAPIECDPRSTIGSAAVAGLLAELAVENERLAQWEVEMNRSGRAVKRGPVCAARERADPAQVVRRRLVNPDLEEPLDRIAVELDLVDRLSGADLTELGRAVGLR